MPVIIKSCQCKVKKFCWKDIDHSQNYSFLEPILLLCVYQKPYIHGWELLQEVPGKLPGCERVDKTTIYRVLHKLEGEGFMVASWNHDEPGPGRRTYEITSIGKIRLQEWNLRMISFKEKLEKLQQEVSLVKF